MKKTAASIFMMVFALCCGHAGAENDSAAPFSPVVEGRATAAKPVLNAKVVMHLDRDQEELLKLALENVKNLFKEIPHEHASVHFVMNGKAVNLFRRDRVSEHGKTIEELSTKGVRFKVCRNALAGDGLGRDDMTDICEIVPAGIVELIKLQHDGYAYVKP